MTTTDLAQQMTNFSIPIYFLSRRYDYTCSYLLAKDYLEKIQAPVKGFYTFEQSAHSPMFEEPENMLRILHEDVLSGVNHLADKQESSIFEKERKKPCPQIPKSAKPMFPGW